MFPALYTSGPMSSSEILALGFEMGPQYKSFIAKYGSLEINGVGTIFGCDTPKYFNTLRQYVDQGYYPVTKSDTGYILSNKSDLLFNLNVEENSIDDLKMDFNTYLQNNYINRLNEVIGDA